MSDTIEQMSRELEKDREVQVKSVTVTLDQENSADVENLLKVLAKAAEAQVGNMFMSSGEAEQQLAAGMNSLVRCRALLIKLYTEFKKLEGQKDAS